MKALKVLTVLILLVFVGCVARTGMVSPGDKPDNVPPKIITGPDNVKIWDRPNAFGPVPANQMEEGKKVCSQIDLVAVGYHPNAQDENGKKFPNGGFLCVPKK